MAGPRSTMLQGFASALLSYDGGGHWVGVPGTAGAGEHSVGLYTLNSVYP